MILGWICLKDQEKYPRIALGRMCRMWRYKERVTDG
jgi:hypothetical protein